uniref:Asparaginyl-tRNA synthetase family protein n=1 Tax=Rhizophora mucronata TaxID=61149 RepID=A0A2P2KAJ8_RHIMU
MGDNITPPVSKLAAATINDAASSSLVLKHPFSDRVPIQSIVSRPDGGAGLAGQRVRVGGWVKTGREQGKGAFAFLEVNDGSCPANLQVIVDAAVADLGTLVYTGTCVSVEGVLKLPPDGTKQKIELRVEQVLHVGPTDPVKYPIPKTKLTLEFLRDHIHLRPRTNTIAAIARIRNALAFATHSFFQEHGFLYIHTPIITTSDCEGAGEMFQVTTLISESEKLEKELRENPPPSEADIEAAKLAVKEKGEVVALLKSAKASKEEVSASVAEYNKAKENLSRVEERSKLKLGLAQKDGKADYALDFFARQAFLTVSGQLQVETYACAVSSVYTFGPTFRAEHSHTSRHLAEFWMVEPEIAFADLKDDMNCAEAYVKYMCQWLLDKCLDDMELMAKLYDRSCIDRLRMVASTLFERISYTEAVQLLEEAVRKGKRFENKVEWGIDLASEHERYVSVCKVCPFCLMCVLALFAYALVFPIS